MSEIKTVSSINLGCKLNFAETSTILRQFIEHGYKLVPSGEPADVIIVNTCTVTSQADKKSRKAVQRAARLGKRVLVTGCSAQMFAELYAQYPNVELVAGAEYKLKLYELFRQPEHQKVYHSEISNVTDYSSAYSSVGRTRSFLKVQDGCDYKCSYCIIPRARGRSRNAPISEIVQQAHQIVRLGYKEIVLTGVNIGDFGRSTGERFIDLLRALEEQVDIPRIRISSIEPELLSDEIIDLVASSKKFLPHFHIPLQSGSDKILRLMRRRYNSSLFRDRIEAIKKRLPEAFIGIDVIVGFPGETDEDFEQSYNFLASLDFSYLHIFPYSDRPGTVASGLPNKVSAEQKRQREKRLKELSDQKHKQFYLRHIGKTANVLLEARHKDDKLLGFTENYIKVKVDYDPQLVNQIVTVELAAYDSADRTVVGKVNLGDVV